MCSRLGKGARSNCGIHAKEFLIRSLSRKPQWNCFSSYGILEHIAERYGSLRWVERYDCYFGRSPFLSANRLEQRYGRRFSCAVYGSHSYEHVCASLQLRWDKGSTPSCSSI